MFCHLFDFLIRKGIGNLSDNPIDEINYVCLPEIKSGSTDDVIRRE